MVIIGIFEAGFQPTLNTQMYSLKDHKLLPVPNLELLHMFPFKLVQSDLRRGEKMQQTDCLWGILLMEMLAKLSLSSYTLKINSNKKSLIFCVIPVCGDSFVMFTDFEVYKE